MKPRIASATLLLLALAALAAASGCGHDHVTQPTPPQQEHGIDQGWPPPPPVPVGLPDTAYAGGTLTQHWWVWNDDSIPFSMKWTLTSDDGWPGLPRTGTVDLGPWEQYILTTTANVPDTAWSGYRGLRLTITRPSGPDFSSYGWFILLP